MSSFIVSRVWHKEQGRVYLESGMGPFSWAKAKHKARRFASEQEAKDFCTKFWDNLPSDIEGQFLYQEVEGDPTGEYVDGGGTEGLSEEDESTTTLDDDSSYETTGEAGEGEKRWFND